MSKIGKNGIKVAKIGEKQAKSIKNGLKMAEKRGKRLQIRSIEIYRQKTKVDN